VTVIKPRIIDKTLCGCRAAEWLRLRLGDRFVHALRTLKQKHTKATALPGLRSGHAARSNNLAIWRPTRPLHI
jgi:hypothetical protein